VIFSTIEKFRLDEDEAVHPILSERRNLIVIADEAHRTRYGLKEGFAYQLRRALRCRMRRSSVSPARR
jgi:type I restriction enzyme R subunit